MTVHGTYIYIYMHLWSFMTSHDIILTSQQSDWDSLLACSSQGCGRLRRGAAPFGCRMLLFFFLTENGTRKRRWRRPSRPCPTLWNHVFHGPFTDLSCLFVDFKAVMEIVIFENTLSDTFSLSAFFSFLTLVLFGSQISSTSVPKGLRFFIHFRESQVPQGHHAAVHWSHPELFTSLRLDHIPSYSIHQLN